MIILNNSSIQRVADNKTATTDKSLELIKSTPEHKVYRRKYGLIRIAGEQDLRKITFEELQKIQKANKDSQVIISSQKIKVPMRQIVLQKIEDEKITVKSELANLPTKELILDENFQIIKGKSEIKLMKEKKPYILTTVHVKDDEPILEPREYIKTARFVKEEDGYKTVYKILKYGEEQ